MLYRQNLLTILSLSFCLACTHIPETEKHQKTRDKVINVRDKIIEINTDQHPISNGGRTYLISDYLIITDYKSNDELIHLYNKENFNYITATTFKGQGPGEISNMGTVVVNQAERIFYVTDHGKQIIFAYELDSVITNPSYTPYEKLKINESLFLNDYAYINDTTCVGTAIKPTGVYGFEQSLVKWNMKTGKIKAFKYSHPKIEKKRVHFAVSTDHNIYVEGYNHHDLLTIGRLDNEELKFNIYGKKWNDENSNRLVFYNKICICGDKIVALYSSGDNNFPKDKEGDIISNYPSQFLLFDLEGNYIKTLETEYRIITFCYDKDYNRIILNMDNEIQFGYMSMEGII